MNILFLMKVFEVGGQEVVTLTLAKSFVEHGHHVGIVCFGKPNPLMTARADKRILFYTLDGFRCSDTNVEKLRAILVGDKVNVVINQWGLPYVPAKVLVKAKVGLGVKSVAVYHNSPDTNARIKDVEITLETTHNPFGRLLLHCKKYIFKLITSRSMRYVYCYSDLYMVLSPSFVEKFKAFTGISKPDHLTVQTNPVTIDASGYSYFKENKRKEIIYMGRIDYNQKRVVRVVDTWAMLEDRFPDWQLTIVGDGPELAGVERRARELGLEHVCFEGFQKPRPYYERASVLMLTSEYEGFPLVLAECMSFGVIPAVYGSYSAVYDIVEDGKNGLILPYDKRGYNAALMAEKLSVLMQSSDERQRMAENAIVTSRKYALEAIYQSWEQLLGVKMNVDEKQLKK